MGQLLADCGPITNSVVVCHHLNTDGPRLWLSMNLIGRNAALRQLRGRVRACSARRRGCSCISAPCCLIGMMRRKFCGRRASCCGEVCHYDPSRVSSSGRRRLPIETYSTSQAATAAVRVQRAVLEKLSDTQIEHNDLLRAGVWLCECVAKLPERDRRHPVLLR